MEKLHELYEDGGFDLIVVDTPPSRHALDFLDAPARLLRLLNNPIFRLLMVPARTGLQIAGAAVQAFIRTVSQGGGRRGRRRHRGVLPLVRGHGGGLPHRARRASSRSSGSPRPASCS